MGNKTEDSYFLSQSYGGKNAKPHSNQSPDQLLNRTVIYNVYG